MTYKTILTSKGTTTIPKEIRDQLGVEPGMYITFTKSSKSGEYIIRRSPTISELRKLNHKALEELKTVNAHYQAGQGFETYITRKYGE